MKNIIIGRELSYLSNLLQRYVESRIRRTVPEDINHSNGWIIGYIYEHSDRDIFQKDLEDEFGVTRSTVSKVVDIMVKKGYILRKAVPYDARLKKLVLTDKAVRIAEDMRGLDFAIDSALVEGLDEHQKAELIECIRKMQQNMERVSNYTPPSGSLSSY